MKKILVYIFAIFFIFGCAQPQKYSWVDTRDPARESIQSDYEACQEFTSKQYKPGIPTGEAFLSEEDVNRRIRNEQSLDEWRPDKNPLQTRNINEQSTHDIDVDFTGYPGELDYYPSYLDDIFEKCMRDRGWIYTPETSAIK